MNVDIEKISDRAEWSLDGLEHASREESLAMLRRFLRVESHRVKMLHRYGKSGMAVAASQARVVDEMIRHVYRMVWERFPDREAGGPEKLAAALVAVGGYGRRELCPASDIDLLILYEKDGTKFSQFLAQELVYLLWDMNLRVGHSWRTPEQSLAMARQDGTAENALIDTRYLAGDRAVFDRLQQLMDKHWASQPRRFVERKSKEIEERYGKLGETVFLLEPNVKESAGGQRDFHAMAWLARGTWQMAGMNDLVGAGVLTEGAWEKARRGYDWITRVRNEMHYQTGRHADQLNFALQTDVAEALQFAPKKHHLASEVFMRDYFQHAEHVHQAMQATLAAARREKARPRKQAHLSMPGNVQLSLSDGELHLADADRDRFPASPVDMMRVFAVAQKMRVQPGEDIQIAVRTHLPMLRRNWFRDAEVSGLFLKVLRRPGWVAPALRAMHSAGLLGKYLPEFGHITRMMQHDYYHCYTTDEHTLRALGLLDAIWRKPPQGMEQYRSLTYHISDPVPLYLALLFHDIGKGLGGGHSEKGALRGVAACERLGLEQSRIDQVELLVRQHLLLSHLSQRRDLSDRLVAQQAAEVTGDLETLSMLVLLTYADTAAVGPGIWTEWKQSLLWELYEKVHSEFLGLEAATEREEARLQQMRRSVLNILTSTEDPDLPELPAPAELAHIWIDQHLSLLPHRYPLDGMPELVARQILMARRAADGSPALSFLPLPELNHTVLQLCCTDTSGLFAKVAGTLAALGVNILGARLGTRKDGMAVDQLWISTPRGHVIDDPGQMRRISETLVAVLADEQALEKVVARIDSTPLGPATKPPRVRLNNEISEHCTVLELLAPDRLGFAYTVSKCLTDMNLNISFAKLATEKTMAFDVLYLTDAAGEKISRENWPAIISQLENTLRLQTRKKTANPA